MFLMIVFVLSFTAIILPAVFTWITIKEAADKAYNKGYQNGYSRAFNEENSWADINGTPMIVAHGICKRWGHDCKTVPEGFCFLGEPQEVVVKGERE